MVKTKRNNSPSDCYCRLRPEPLMPVLIETHIWMDWFVDIFSCFNPVFFQFNPFRLILCNRLRISGDFVCNSALIDKEIVAQSAGVVSEHSMFRLTGVGIKSPQPSNQNSHFRNGQGLHTGPIHQRLDRWQAIAHTLVIAEPVSFSFEILEWFQVGLLLRGICSSRRKGTSAPKGLDSGLCWRRGWRSGCSGHQNLFNFAGAAVEVLVGWVWPVVAKLKSVTAKTSKVAVHSDLFSLKASFFDTADLGKEKNKWLK